MIKLFSNNMYKKVILFFLLLCINTQSQNIKTIQLRPLNSNAFTPTVSLGSTLELSFDDLDADNKEYQYKIAHMDRDWQPSKLIPNQYINGFDSDYINDITNSFNTLQDYTHYRVQIPNRNTIITKSGNYLISILNNDDEVVFTRRCIFYESLTTVGVSVLRSRDIKEVNKGQTVQLLINHPELPINNAAQEVNVTVIQNNNWLTAINNIKPQYFKPNQLIYNYIDKTNFLGGNEFLNFDTKDIRNTNLNIAKVNREDVFHSYIYTDVVRKKKQYSYNPDINGQFSIRSLESEDPNTEADYATMHFSLDIDKPLKNKEVYIYGNFNGFSFNEKNKMFYNTEAKLYEISLPLKQGFYNYNFATRDVNNNNISLTEIDGSFYQTENEYTTIVYYRTFGTNYDRVIGVGTGFFNQNN